MKLLTKNILKDVLAISIYSKTPPHYTFGDQNYYLNLIYKITNKKYTQRWISNFNTFNNNILHFTHLDIKII